MATYGLRNATPLAPAIHESSHAVIGSLVGLQVLRVSITPETVTVMEPWAPRQGATPSELAIIFRDQLAALMAGEEGEKVFCVYGGANAARLDRQQQRTITAAFAHNFGDAWTARQTTLARSELAQYLVNPRVVSTIEHVASVLLRRGSLSGTELQGHMTLMGGYNA